MSTLVIPYTFADNTDAEAAEVNACFAALFGWVNTQGIHADGTNAFTEIPALPAEDPTTDNQATRKAYVDDKAGGVIIKKTSTSNVAVAGASEDAWGGFGSLVHTFTPESGHWYEVALQIPNLHCGASTEENLGNGLVDAAIFRGDADLEDATRVETYRTKQTQVGEGTGVRLVHTWQAASADETTVHAAVRQSVGTTAIETGANGNAPVTFVVKDLGVGA